MGLNQSNLSYQIKYLLNMDLYKTQELFKAIIWSYIVKNFCVVYARAPQLRIAKEERHTMCQLKVEYKMSLPEGERYLKQPIVLHNVISLIFAID